MQGSEDANRRLGLHLEKPMPKKELPVALEDIAWVVCQLAEQSPASLFGEIRKQNQELLRALSELQGYRAPPAAAAAREATSARPAA